MSFVFASTTYTAIEALVRLHLRQNTPLMTDACYDRGSTFLLFFFMSDGTPSLKIVGNRQYLFHDSRCVASPGGLLSGHGLIFSSKSVFGGGLKHSKLRNLRKKGVHLHRSTRRTRYKVIRTSGLGSLTTDACYDRGVPRCFLRFLTYFRRLRRVLLIPETDLEKK